jgi:hypothetical protein
MVITEEELRQHWQNGKGQIPTFAPGTRFTPSALDFLKAHNASPESCTAPLQAVSPAGPEELELKATGGGRLIYTAQEVTAWLQQGVKVLRVHASVTLTDSAREKLRGAGVRILPITENAPPSPPALPLRAVSPSGADEALFRQVKQAVLARLNVPVDEAVLDAVLRRVLAEYTR